jgi:hypothetical protein
LRRRDVVCPARFGCATVVWVVDQPDGSHLPVVLVVSCEPALDGGDDAYHGLATVLKAALVIVGAAGIAAWLALGLFHLGDRYRVGHAQGHWMALARYADEGRLYPPLFDGVRFGGTRYMPLPILVNAAASSLTGEYLRSGKAVAIVLFAALLVLVFVVLRQLRCPWPLAVGLTGLLPATNTGVLVGSTIGGDVLPAVFQIGALMAVTTAVRRDRVGWLIAAGALAGLAACSKLTGVWAAMGVLTWFAFRQDWRRLGWFLAACCTTTILTLGIVQWASQGRFLTTFLTLTFAGTGGPIGWIRAPSQLTFFGIGDAPAVWMVAPFAILGTLAAWRSSVLTVYHHALGWSLLLTLVVFTDMGAGLNQLLDPAILTVVAVGVLVSSLPLDRLGATTLATTLTIAVIWAGATGVRGLVPDLREVVASARTGQTLRKYNPRPLADAVARGDTLLAEDPSIPVLLGQTPILLDAFMLRRLDEVQPQAVDVLVARIERGEFDRVALIMPLEDEDFWWQYYHLGLRVVRALRHNYVLMGQVDGYFVYQPRVRTG